MFDRAALFVLTVRSTFILNWTRSFLIYQCYQIVTMTTLFRQDGLKEEEASAKFVKCQNALPRSLFLLFQAMLYIVRILYQPRAHISFCLFLLN